jgi:hypothetical protein
MPDATFGAMTLNDSYPPMRPNDPAITRSSPIPPRIPSLPVGTGKTPSPAPSNPPELNWEHELDNERDNAMRTSNPDIALAWAEKVYMHVSISLEEIRREQELRGQGSTRPFTPPYEKQLLTDCVAIVEKYVRANHPKAVARRHRQG